MKKLFCTLLFVSAFFAQVSAQVSSNPNDPFYGNVSVWEIQGVLDNVPQVRPYPLHIVEKILKQVIDSEIPLESEKAEREYERIFKRPFHLETSENVSFLNKENGKKKVLFDADGHVQGDWQFYKYAGLSYSLGLFAVNGNEKEKFPREENIAHDAIVDSVGYGKFNAYVEVNSNLFFGNDKIFGTAGINRFGFGPFWQEGLALNDTAYHHSGFSYTVNFLPNLSFTQVYSSMGASNNFGEGTYSSKYLALHSVKWNVTPKIGLCYYENIIFGRRNEISYFFPVPYMTNQNINGCNDNLQMGLLFECRPVSGLKVSWDFFADDMSLHFKGFDDRFHFASSLGTQYSLKSSLLRLVDLNYSIVMPFVYAHWEFNDENSWTFSGKTINYQNYTNNGRPIGSTLAPDSDKVRLKMKLEPVQNLDVNLSCGISRHQNVCEVYTESEAFGILTSTPGTFKTDGSIFNHQWGPQTITRCADRELAFMKGDYTMWNFSTGIDTSYTVSTSKAGTFKIGIGYDFEFIKNAGVDRDMYPCYGNAISKNEDGTYSWNGNIYKNAGEVVGKAKADWVSNLHNEINHYLSVNFTFIW